MPAYMISHVTVTDQTKFQDYIAKTRGVAAKFGGNPVAIGGRPKVLHDASADHQMVFVIQFESMEVLDKWHSSDDYQALVALREEGSQQHMMAYEGMAAPG